MSGKACFRQIEAEGANMGKLKSLHIENFTVFDKLDIEFCDGVNVIIGANSTGKSHLLKVLYAVIQAIPAQRNTKATSLNMHMLIAWLHGVFRPEEYVTQLLRSKEHGKSAVFHVTSENGHHYAELFMPFHITSSAPPAGKGLFIPPNEVLAIYPGFVASYE